MSGEILCYLPSCASSQEILRTPGTRITWIPVIHLYLVIQRNNQSCPYKSHAVNCLITCVVFPVTCLSVFLFLNQTRDSSCILRLRKLECHPDQIGFHTVLNCNNNHKIKSESFQLLPSNFVLNFWLIFNCYFELLCWLLVSEWY